MPRIPDEHLDCIATIFAKRNNALFPSATAFLVSHKDDFCANENVYLVTCIHCRQAELKDIVFSTGETISFDRSDWKDDPEGNDVMARDVTDILPVDIRKRSFPHLRNQISNLPRQFRNSEVGDEIYMLGLHAAESHKTAVAPRARFGNISSWADDKEPVKQGNDQEKPSHIGDMRSRPGFSGSPVFTVRDGTDYNDSPKPMLLGVHSGQFRDDIKVRTPDKIWGAWAPSSMTIIVPAWALEFIINDPDFKQGRAERLWEPNDNGKAD